MAQKRKVKQPVYKKSGFYFCILYAILNIAFIIQMTMVNVLPMKYLIPIMIVLIVIFVGLGYLQLGRRVNKLNSVLGKVLIVIMSILLGIGNFYLYKTSHAVNKITDNDTQKSVISVVTLADNKAAAIADLKNSNFAVVKTGSQENVAKAMDDIKKDVGQDVTKTEYKSVQDASDDLYAGKIDALVMDEGTRALYKDVHEKFDTETKIIKSYTYTTEKKQTGKAVDVTKEPFNVYLSGIDTYGEIDAVSRSDVNMIATVNPTTHQILLTSIPRDFYIAQTCQGNQQDKLTHTGIFGVECTLDSMENFAGVSLNYYARANFNSVENIVDAIGGIDIYNQSEFYSGVDLTYFAAGDINVDGSMALKFSRERHAYDDGDRQRGRNQMIVLEAIFKKATSPAIITGYAGIMDAVSGNFQTNMSQSDITSFIKMQINSMAGWEIKQISVSGVGETTYSPANGFDSYVMVPDMNTVNNATTLINKMMNNEQITDQDVQHQNDLVANVGN